MDETQLENPVLGYVVIAVALIVGMLSATVFGQALPRQVAASRPAAESADRAPLGNDLHAAVWINPESDPLSQRRLLGVRAEATSTGCLVAEIVPGTGAEIAGLDVGDRILAVDGRQVGWVGQRLVSLREAVDQIVAPTTSLLVQRNLHGRIVSVEVQLLTPAQTLGN
ncbi:PDZ domain-containing protein [Roseiconus nitratireducens]|uniref:PDZ domain-containing protein n=1 Tax=Roseiconus nitratireducens TaxID=2605748 RepID=A0A5M6DBV0_9BACT|nr:PDZ domain-containing protein [Roseiconus nitratireducens]KAA5543870.1 PDZ domain-containing protein [Roseiconus nitratireducens]